MYTDKQASIIATLLDKWQHRNAAYNSIIVSNRQFEALRNVLTESNLCGHISYIGVSPDGRAYGICYNRSRGWYTMTVDKTAAEREADKQAEQDAKKSYIDPKNIRQKRRRRWSVSSPASPEPLIKLSAKMLDCYKPTNKQNIF